MYVWMSEHVCMYICIYSRLKLLLCVYVCIHRCVHVWVYACVYIHVCACEFMSAGIYLPQHTRGSQGTTLGVDSWLLACLKQDSFAVSCCMWQASWPSSFWGSSCPCLLKQKHKCFYVSFMQILEMHTQVMFRQQALCLRAASQPVLLLRRLFFFFFFFNHDAHNCFFLLI